MAEDLTALEERLRRMEELRAKEDATKRHGNFMGKFGKLFENDDEIGDMLLEAMDKHGGDPESATEEAVIEFLLRPLGEWAQSLTKKLGKALEAKIEEVVEGTPPMEGAPPIPAVDVPNEPLPPPPADMGPPPPMDAGGTPPMEPPPPAPEGAMPPPPVAVSDDRFKNIRPVIVSDERFKNFGEVSDERLKVLEAMCQLELSDEDLKEVMFGPVDAPDEPLAPAAVTLKQHDFTELSDQRIKKPLTPEDAVYEDITAFNKQLNSRLLGH